MCGRFTYYTPPETLLLNYFPDGLEVDGQFPPRYNITPGVGIPMIRARLSGPAVMAPSLWGFRPTWAGDTAPAPINARAETAARSRYFSEAFAHHRCVIPANGWYEWTREGPVKQPWYITRSDDSKYATLFFAGLWTPFEGDETTACAIITEPAAEHLRHIHDRQPVVLDPGCLADWLNPDITDRQQIRAVSHRLPARQLTAWPVSPAVNNPRNDSAELIRKQSRQD